MNVKSIVAMIIGIISACCQIIVAAALLFWFSKSDKIPSASNKIDFSVKIDDPDVNFPWFSYYFPVFLGVISLVLAVFEILLIIPPFQSFSSLFDAPLFRAVYYLAVGILTIGYSGDLGIAAGALGLLSGILTIVSGIFSNI